MYPLLHIAGKEIATYAIMAMVGALIAGSFAEHQAVKRGVHPFYMIEVLGYSAIGLFLGGHLLYGLVHLDQLQNGFLYAFGGQVFYGGLLGALLTGAIVIHIKKYDKTLYYDIAGATIPLFHFFARIGCFLGGCCYGIESEFGFTFTESLSVAANGVSRFPVQLLESGLNLVLFFVLYWMLRKEMLKGRLLSVYLGIYAIMRFCLEFLRGDILERGMWFGLSTSQWISVIILLVLLIQKIIRSRKPSADI